MIDKDEAIRLLRKEVANKGGDFRYESPFGKPTDDESQRCVYFYNNQPSCIVGHALADVGVTQQDITVDVNMDFGAVLLYQQLPDILDSEASQIFSSAQSVQDRGLPWSMALENAESVYRELGGTE